jgi:hypothetical protein
VVDRDPGKLVPLGELRGELRHHVLGHSLVGLVLEVEHAAITRSIPDRAEECGDRARFVARYLAHSGLDGEGRVGQSEVAAGNGRDQRDLVALGELRLDVRVALVDRVEQAGGSSPSSSAARRRRRGAVGELELARAGAARSRSPAKSRMLTCTPQRSSRRVASPGVSCYVCLMSVTAPPRTNLNDQVYETLKRGSCAASSARARR